MNINDISTYIRVHAGSRGVAEEFPVLFPHGPHQGLGRDFSLRPDMISVEFYIGSDGKPAATRLWASGMRIKHLKAGDKVEGRRDVNLFVFELPSTMKEIIEQLAVVAAEKWAQLTGQKADNTQAS